MTIVFNFNGGSLNAQVLSTDTERPAFESQPAFEFYRSSNSAELGTRFVVPHRGGADLYEVVRRTENSRCLYVQAEHVAV